MAEYAPDPEWVPVNQCGSPLVARKMLGKVIHDRPQLPALTNDQPEPA